MPSSASPHVCKPGCQHGNLASIGVSWCVTAALELIERGPAAAVEFNADISGMDPYVGIGQPPNTVAWGSWHIDREYALTTDVTKPVMVVELVFRKTPPDHDGSPIYQIIDGWHRIYHGRTLGLDVLPGLLLTAETERAVRSRDAASLLCRD